MRKEKSNIYIYILAFTIAFGIKLLTFFYKLFSSFLVVQYSVISKSYNIEKIAIHPFESLQQPLNSIFPWQNFGNVISERFSITNIVLFYQKITHLPLDVIMFLPIGGIIIIIVSYNYARYIFYMKEMNSGRPEKIAILYMLFIAFYTNEKNQLFYTSFGMILVYLVFYSIIKTFRRLEKPDVLLTILFAIILFFTYYSAEFLTLLILWGFVLVSYGENLLKKTKKIYMKNKNLVFVTLFLTILFFSFDTIFYKFLTPILTEWSKNVPSSIIDYFKAIWIFGAKSESIQVSRAFSSKIPLYADLVIKSTIVSTMFLYVLVLFKKVIIRKEIDKISIIERLTAIIIFVGLVQFLIYASRGFIHLQFLVIYATPIVFFLLINIRVPIRFFKYNKYIGTTIVLIVVTLSAFKFVNLLYESDSSYFGQDYYYYTGQSSFWLSKYVKEGNVISDYYTSSLIFYNLVIQEKDSLVYCFRSFDTYKIFYEKTRNLFYNFKRNFDILVISDLYSSKIIVGDAWGPFYPMLNSDEISTITDLFYCKVFDDRHSTIYLTTYK